MAQLMTIQLSKGDSPNLGFRLQGGKDFAAPLVIQKVNGGSPAERAGLIAGDAVIKINNTDVFNLRHKDAQDVIIKAGPSFTVTVQRGGSTWKPAVTPTGHNPVLGASINNISPVTQTSLAAQPQPSIGAIGTGHNLSAKPFLNGTANGGPKLVNKQYNSPVGLYSEQSIAETLSAQSEVLSTGVLGVNFKKNEKGYDASKSAVYHMLQEAEKEPRDSEPVSRSDFYARQSHAIGGRSGDSLTRSCSRQVESRPNCVGVEYNETLTRCTDCERVIVGVFVRIKDKNLHVECFKCSTCGASLKNVGYYNINNKLYCDIHAKLAAKNNPPAPNLVPVTIPPGGKAPAGTISAALASHSFPSPGPQSPKAGPLSPSTNITATPFQSDQLDHNENIKDEDDIDIKLLKTLTIAASKKSNANLDQLPITEKEFSNTKPSYLTSTSIRPAPISHNQSYNKGVSNFSSAPRPFSSVSAPLSPNSFSKPLPRTLPPAPAPQTPVSAPVPPKVHNIVWPPIQDEVELPTASPLYFAPPSQIQLPEKVYEAEERDYTELEDYNNFLEKEKMDQKMSVCSSEVYNLTGRKSAVECVETIAEHLQTQMLVESVMKGRPKTPPPLDVDPIPPIKEVKVEKEVKSEGIVTAICPCNKSCCNQNCDSCPCKEPPELKRPNDYTKPPPQSKITNAVPQKYESPLVTALKTTPDKPYALTQIPQKHSSTPLASALSIAPSEPFNPIQPFTTRDPVPLPEETVPYLPPEHPMFIPEKVVKKEIPKSQSPFVEALKIAPDRPFTPVGGLQKKKVKEDPLLKDLPKPQERISMLAALTTAPDRSYSPFLGEATTGTATSCEQECKKKKVEPCGSKPSIKQPVPQPFICSMVNTFEGGEVGINTGFPPVSQELKQEGQHVDYSNIKGEIEAQITEQRKLGQQDGQIMYEAHVGQNRQNLVGQESQMAQMSLQESQMRMQQSQVRQEYQVKQQEMYRQEESCRSQVRQESHVSQVKQESYVSQQESQMRQQQIQQVSQQDSQVRQQQIQQGQVSQKQGQIARQSEEIIMKKPMNLASNLHKSEYLPQYQTSLEYEEEIQLPHHKSINKLLQPQKPQTKIIPDTRPLLAPQTQTPPPQITKPVRTLQGGYTPTNPQTSFQPVTDDFHPPKASMAQRVGQPGTPSLINKPPSAIPYYQQNLVATEHLAPESNLFDPKSPAVSRSPSPCPGRERSPSPFPSKPRAKSPAAGPPPNPLSVNKVSQEGMIPDVKVEKAKESLSCYIPQHREKLEMIKKFEGGDLGGSVVSGRSEVRSEVNEGNFQRKDYGVQEFRGQESQKFGSYQEGNLNVSVSEKAKLQEEKQLSQSEMKSVESCGDGRVVQRRKVVKEEFEHTHKEKTVEIEKSSTKTTHPFQKVNAPVIEDHQGIIGLHVTNPHPLNSPFFNKPPGPPIQPPQPPQPPKRVIPPQNIPPPTKTPIVPSKLNVPVVPSISCGDNVKPNVPVAPSVGSSGRQQGGSVFAPKRGRGVLNVGGIGARIAQCGHCHQQIRGPFITALGKIWCPEHFTCATPSCKRPLQDIGFVEERGQLHCEYCFEQYLAPNCSKCNIKIKGDCLKAIGKNFHPECFNCAYCGKLFANSPFFLEDGLPYCEADWNEMFTTKCFACGFPVEAGDRWVEALNNNYHSQCFNCTMCKKNLEGQSFFAKGGRPFCKNHAR